MGKVHRSHAPRYPQYLLDPNNGNWLYGTQCSGGGQVTRGGEGGAEAGGGSVGSEGGLYGNKEQVGC